MPYARHDVEPYAGPIVSQGSQLYLHRVGIDPVVQVSRHGDPVPVDVLPALRFGEPRVMALAGALSLTLFGACGLNNKSLRALTARLLGPCYSASQMTYDLRRPRLNGLIRRLEHTHTYVLTPDGQRLAIFFTKVYDRLLRPLAPADQPQAAPELRRALAVIDHHVDGHIARARLKPAA